MGTSCSICKKTKSKSNVEVAKDNSNKENASKIKYNKS